MQDLLTLVIGWLILSPGSEGRLKHPVVEPLSQLEQRVYRGCPDDDVVVEREYRTVLLQQLGPGLIHMMQVLVFSTLPSVVVVAVLAQPRRGSP